jgi:histidinol-phosphate phosphatase family protein
MNFNDLYIDHSWSLFLDRDGVINKRIIGGYVTVWQEFEFLDGVIPALKILHQEFDKIFVVTNQQGVGKGLMTGDDLKEVHYRMVREIESGGGRIDKVYVSPYLESEKHPTRKPGIGMARLAERDFPEIDLKRSIMVGDSLTDMKFGRDAGMITVFTGMGEEIKDPSIDIACKDLMDFALRITSGKLSSNNH